MTIYFRALIVCDRCDAELNVDDVSDEAEVERRLRNCDSEWAADEDGNDVCGECWRKWNAKHSPSAPAATSGETEQELDTSDIEQEIAPFIPGKNMREVKVVFSKPVSKPVASETEKK